MKFNMNQLGFRPKDKKVFVVNENKKYFKIIKIETGEIVYQGNILCKKEDKASLDTIYYGDFTEVCDTGYFCIEIEGYVSPQFMISMDIYQSVRDGLLKGLYYQRCGMKLEKEIAGEFKHEACHTELASLYENQNIKKDVSGGWHDAGDYGRYVVPAGKTVADMMLTYEFFSSSFLDNSLPNLLEEVKYEIDWLFKMQDEKTGGVYHKVATQYFAPKIMPEDDQAPLILYPISTPATGHFAAALAMASRLFKKYDSTFAEKCLEKAEHAWGYLETHDEELFKNKPDIGSGEYGDTSDLDERIFASAELYRVTKKETYHTFFKQNILKLEPKRHFSWNDVSLYGILAYLLTEMKDVDKALHEKLMKQLLSDADKLVDRAVHDGYGITLSLKEYIWGSNMVVLNHAMLLIIACHLNYKKTYIDTALSNWHYILGYNPLGICYVTGFGSHHVMHPHHRPSMADGIDVPVPGLLAGGPCATLRDATAKEKLVGFAPAKCFIDDENSYSTNEIAIYWNSVAIFVATYFTQ